MKRLFPGAAVLGALLMLQSSMWAAPKSPVVTRDNFVSLEYSTLETSSGARLRLSIEGNQVRLTTSAPVLSGLSSVTPFSSVTLYDSDTPFSGFTPFSGVQPGSKSAPLSNNQLDALIKVINQLRLADIQEQAQKDKEPRTSENLTLVVSDEKNDDRTFVINSDDLISPKYSRLKDYLRQIQTQKFEKAVNPTSDFSKILATPLGKESPLQSGGFQSLTFETSGGIANIKSRLAIVIFGNNISASYSPEPYIRWSRTGNNEWVWASLTPGELQPLIQLLKDEDFPSLAGNYAQPNLADGINEVLTLTLTASLFSSLGPPQFVVKNYGDQAPKGYYKITEYLRQLQQKKFPAK